MEPRTYRRADRWMLPALAAVATVLALPYLCGIGMLDEGALVHVAERIAGGEVLYRDVATGIMPGSYYLHAVLFRVVGPSLLAGRVLMIVLFTIAAGGMFLLLRAVTNRIVAAAATLSFTALTVNYWRYPNYSPEAIVLILGMLGAAIAYLRTGRRRWLAVAGLLLGLALIFKQNYGAFASLGLAAGLLSASGPWRRRIRDVALAAGIAAIPLLVMVVLLGFAGALPAFWNNTVQVPLQVPATVFARPFPPAWGPPDDRLWRDLLQYLPFDELFTDHPIWVFDRTDGAMAVVRTTFYLPVLLLGIAAVAWLRRRHDPDRGVGGLLVAVAALLFLGVFPRADAHHLVLVLPPWFLAVGWLAGRRPGIAVRAAWILVAAVLLGFSVAAQIAVIDDPQPHRIRDAWLPLPRAGIWVPRSTGRSVERVLGELEARVPPGEPVFVGPASPMYYFLAARRNPTRYPLILPGAMDEEEVIRDLGTVRWGLLQDGAFEDFTFENVAPEVWRYLRGNFRMVDGAGDRTPLPPYLVERGDPYPPPEPEWLSLPEGPGHWAPGHHAWSLTLMRPSLSPPPPYRIISRDPWRDPQRLRVSWSLSYLRPSLLVTAPWGWRKLLISVEAPVAEGSEFRFACALDPEGWGRPGRDGQGAMAEVWVGGADGPPRRAWIRWMDPRRRAADRRWLRGAIDLASFVPAGETARITLVSDPSPGFDGTDAKIAWSELEQRGPGLPGPARFVETPPEAAAVMLTFAPEDLDLFQAAAAAYDDVAGVQSAVGEVARSLGRYGEALAAYGRAAALEPENGTYTLRQAEVLEEAGRPDEALVLLREAVARRPDEPGHLAALATLLASRGDLGGALRAARRAAELDPGHAWALGLLTRLELASGNLREAAAAGRRATAAAPESVRPWIDLADALREGGDPGGARAALRRAAALDLDGGSRAVVAQGFVAAGDARRGLREAERAVARDPESVPARAAVAIAAGALGDHARAVEAWEQADRLEPGSFGVLIGLGPALDAAGRREEALAALRRAGEAAAGDAASLGRLARAYARMGHTSEAMATWRQVLALAPGGDLEAEARREIAAGSG